jgi:alanyl-tRNA synthetase
MTERLYYGDSSLTEFDANVEEISADGLRLYFDRTAFYPTSGGQPFDMGDVNGVPVADVIDEGERIAHVLSAAVSASQVHCRIDMARRRDHMQQHTGQHLLSAVLAEMYGIATVSFHLGAESSTIDVDVAALDAGKIAAVERHVNEVVMENRAVGVSYEDAAFGPELRKASERKGTLRIVSIAGLDRSACGGTHVKSTGEIGPVLIRRLDKIRGIVRIEFLCGLRAVARARADFDALSQIARAFSSPADETPALTVALIERSKDAEKAYRKLAVELSQYKGRELYEQTATGADGLRRHYREIAKGPADDDLRSLAQSFAAQPKAVFVALTLDPPAVLLAASADSGVHAGNVVKSAVTDLGGRGGGSAGMAQGSVPAEALTPLKAALGM